MNDPKQKYNIFTCVINADKKSTNPAEELALLQNTLLTDIFSFVATIIHDKDLTDNGEPKTIHTHAYIETNEKHTKKQFLDMLTELLKIDRERISIEGTKSNVLMLQYLTHKNQPSKAQYEVDRIITNNKELLIERMNTQYKTKEEKENELKTDIKNYKTLLELMEKYGVDTANKVKGLFNQIKEEQKQDYQSLVKEIELYKIILRKIYKLLNEPYITNQENELRDSIIKILDNYSINQ